MTDFVQGENRHQNILFPERLDDYVGEDSAVRVIDVFVDELVLSGLGFKEEPNDLARPGYHPGTMLKIFLYGYLNRVQSSRRLEREAQRTVELMWLTGRSAPDFKTISDFRKDNGEAIRMVCREFVLLCRQLNLFADAFVAIDSSKFKAANNRDRNWTKAKLKRQLQRIDETIDRYLTEMASSDRQESAGPGRRSGRLQDKIGKLKEEMRRCCPMHSQCTTGVYRRVSRYEFELVLDEVHARLDREPKRMRVRRATAEHPFGTLKSWMGSTHFLMKTLKNVSTEMSLHALAYNMKRMIQIMGTVALINAISA